MKKTVQVKLDEDDISTLKEDARKNGHTLSSLLRHIVKNNLKDKQGEIKIAEFFGHDLSEGPFKLYDIEGNIIFHNFCFEGLEVWAKMKWENGKMISKECLDGYWWKEEYDSEGNSTSFICSNDDPDE